jgi:hypothetical protein
MTASPRPPPRVVIVHNGANRQSTIEFLTNAGLTVASVHEGEDVFGGIVASNPDIIVWISTVMDPLRNDSRAILVRSTSPRSRWLSW